MDTVQVVLGCQLGIDRHRILDGIRVARIEPIQAAGLLLAGVAGHQPVLAPFGAGPVHVVGVAGVRGGHIPTPDSQGRGPGVDLDARSVGPLDQVGQGVKAGSRIRCPRIDLRGIVGVPPAAHLDYQRVEVSGLGRFDQFVDLLLALDARAVGIHP